MCLVIKEQECDTHPNLVQLYAVTVRTVQAG